jgi:Cys-tRNA(Pro)/Cys-tRNA(Cys) deacylase
MTADAQPVPSPSPHDEIVRRLTEAGVPFTIHTHAALRTVEDASARSGFDEERFLKTLLFRGGTDTWALVSLRGRDRLNYQRLAAALGVSRSSLAAATPVEVEAVTGCEAGAVSPVPTREGLPLLIDEVAATLGTVYTGSGRPDRTLEIALADLITTVRPRIASLRRDDTGR